MAKKVIAKTNISYGTADGDLVEFKLGDEVDTGKYGITKEQLEQLYDSGAIAVEEIPEPVKATPAKVPPAKDVKSSGPSDTA